MLYLWALLENLSSPSTAARSSSEKKHLCKGSGTCARLSAPLRPAHQLTAGTVTAGTDAARILRPDGFLLLTGKKERRKGQDALHVAQRGLSKVLGLGSGLDARQPKKAAGPEKPSPAPAPLPESGQQSEPQPPLALALGRARPSAVLTVQRSRYHHVYFINEEAEASPHTPRNQVLGSGTSKSRPLGSGFSSGFEGRGGVASMQSSLPCPGLAPGAWTHRVTEGRTRLSDFTFTFHFHALEMAMATHSSVLACRIPGTGKPGRLPSMGSPRVGHN